VTFGEGFPITIDLLRRREGEVFECAVCVLCIEDMELNELAGVYCVDGVLTCDGVENVAAARRVLVAAGER
jgi:hypothetical protein